MNNWVPLKDMPQTYRHTIHMGTSSNIYIYITHCLSGWPKKNLNFKFTTKMVFPKSLKFMNSGSEYISIFIHLEVWVLEVWRLYHFCKGHIPPYKLLWRYVTMHTSKNASGSALDMAMGTCTSMVVVMAPLFGVPCVPNKTGDDKGGCANLPAEVTANCRQSLFQKCQFLILGEPPEQQPTAGHAENPGKKCCE